MIAFACDLFMTEIRAAIDSLLTGPKKGDPYLSEFSHTDLRMIEKKALLLIQRVLQKVQKGLIVQGLVGVQHYPQ